MYAEKTGELNLVNSHSSGVYHEQKHKTYTAEFKAEAIKAIEVKTARQLSAFPYKPFLIGRIKQKLGL